MIPETVAFGLGNDLAGHIVGFRAFVGCFVDRNGVALTVGRPEPLAFSSQIVGNHRIGCIQNGLGRTVILLQPDGSGTPVLLFKVQDILDGSTTETVNTLVVVTHHTDIFVAACQQAGQQVLHMVGILILVHQDIAEFPLVILPHILVFQKQFDSHIDDVIKIQGVVVLQPGLIFDVGSGNVQRPEITGPFCRVQHLLRGDHPILFLADGSKNILGREGLIIQTHILDDLLHDPLGIGGIVNSKAAGIAHSLNVPPQNPAAGTVEGHCPDILGLRAKKDRKTFLQFVGSLVGKGDGHNAPGHGPFHGAQIIRPPAVIFIDILPKAFKKSNVLFCHRIGDLIGITAPAEAHDIGNPVNQDCGFAAAGTGQKQQRAFRGQHRFLLHIVQFLKLAADVILPCFQKTHIQILAHSRTCP